MRATTWDVMRAQAGYLTSKGVKREESAKLTKEDIEELQEMMEAEERRMAARAGNA